MQPPSEPSDEVPGVDDNDVQPAAPASQTKEMGLGPAVAWTLLVLAALVVAQTFVVLVFFVIRMMGRPLSDLEQVAEELNYDGTAIAVATCSTTLVCVALVALIARVSGWNVRDYLRLHWPEKRSHVVVSLVTLIGFLACSDGLTILLGRRVVPEFMVQAYETSASLPLLLFAIIVAAPIGEEIIFRGFVIRSMTRSLGPAWAIFVSAALWSGIHLQYDWYGLLNVFVGGLLLGAIYHRTASTALCIVLHALWNIAATLEVVIYVEFMQ